MLLTLRQGHGAEIVEAIDYEEVAMLENVLQKLQDPNELLESLSRTALVEVVLTIYDSMPWVQLLLESEADVNLRTPSGETALISACAFGPRPSLVQCLLQAAADANLPGRVDRYYGPPLFHTSFDGYRGFLRPSCNGMASEVVHALVRAGADPDWATCCDDPVDPELYSGPDTVIGSTPLHAACACGLCEEALALLEARADPNKPDIWGRSPGCVAAEAQMEILIPALVSASADLNRADGWGRTPLWAAAFHDHCRTVSALLLARVDADQSDTWGRTPLRAAAEADAVDVVTILVLGGATIDLSDSWGDTPLLAACQRAPSLSAALSLVFARADASKVDSWGRTVPQILIDTQRHEVDRRFFEWALQA